MAAIEFTDQDREDFKRLKFGAFHQTAEEFFHVNHRDRVGQIVPYTLRKVQLKREEYVRECLKLNVLREYEAEKQGNKSYIENLTERLERGEDINEWEVGLRILDLKYRRVGASTYWGHKGLRRVLTLPHYFAAILAQDADTAGILFDIPRISYDQFKNKKILPHVTTDRSERFELSNKSRYRIVTAGAKDQRDRLRGDRVDFLHLAEYAHYKTYRDVAQAMGVLRPHAWVIKETTVKGKANAMYRDWQNAMWVWDVRKAFQEHDYAALANWNGHYRFFSGWLEDDANESPIYDWEREPFRATLSSYEKELLERFPEDCTLGKLKWRRERIKDLENDPDVLDAEASFKHEYPATVDEAFTSVNQSVFDQHSLEIIRERGNKALAQQGGPAATVLLSSGMMPIQSTHGSANCHIYFMPEEGHKYVLGGDISMGVGKDDSIAVILDRCDGTTMKEVAVLHSNRIAPNDLGHILVMLAEFYNKAFICPEINMPGLATCKVIVEDCLYPQIYKRKPLDMIGMEVENIFHYGFLVNHQSKQVLVADAREAVSDRTLQLFHHAGIEQLSVFEQDPEKNRYSAPIGEKDDYVIALSLAVFACRRVVRSMRQTIDDFKAQRAANPGDAPSWEAENNQIWKQIMGQMDASIRQNKRIGGPGLRPALPDKVAKATGRE